MSDRRVRVVILALLLSASCAAPRAVTVRHDDGTSSMGGQRGGLRDGVWTEFYSTGRKQSEGSYASDVQTGLWTYWFENGQKEMEGRFVDERREGEWTSWYESGALRARGRFERGFEEWLWRFYDGAGVLEHEGPFEIGQPVLRWNYFHPDGSVRATGNYLGGVKVGEWIARDATGNTTVSSYPFPSGCALVEERFADGTPKRAGFLRAGVPAGRWMTEHPGGKLRFECTFSAGAPNGPACAWREDGSLLATGSLKDGCMHGAWVCWRGGVPETIEYKKPRPRQAFDGEWSPATSADRPVSLAVETWVAEVCSPRQPEPIHSVSLPAAPAAESSLASSASTSSASATASPTATQAEPSGIPARAQPWTEYERSALPALVELYGAGERTGARDIGEWTPSEIRSTRSKLDAGVAQPAELVGRALPLTRFTTAEGGVIDLGDYVGKQFVLVTILRGFGGQVCVYCTAQTKGLAEFAEEFAALDTAVVVVFPGPASGLEAFLAAYRRTFGPGEEPPYKLLYDTGLALTRALRIEDNIAVPTSLVLDRAGIVRWCHVAKDHTDRPSAKRILAEIAALSKAER